MAPLIAASLGILSAKANEIVFNQTGFGSADAFVVALTCRPLGQSASGFKADAIVALQLGTCVGKHEVKAKWQAPAGDWREKGEARAEY